MLCEALGNPDVHVSVCPQLSAEQARHPAWPGHLATLRGAGVTVTPVAPDQPWTRVLDALPVAGTDRP
nr:hypothetical protein [Kibdelosporangium sp. MJ126-NF4]CTQ89828.1 hypothetical protein [Kibdelosporangium sp. MJ126-NF4]